ncbi:prepilin type IV pili [Burkholderia territorii]|uniref:Prepilin type IV pili n=1 Tax=Burkholderia territorii TaxID=1503055 RepID=A0A106DR80_9BURK|nr:prepilin type IV pili [Burkholderia territorii]KVV40925.1 prepilin type IV pili [Burkholderia territorii]KVX33872.1 prepilin type IV pili [Burkholderia territorii]
MEGILGRIVAIVLGLLALAGVGVAAYSGFSNNKASNVTEGLTTTITNARAQFTQGSNGYTNFTTAKIANLITAGIFPNNWVNGTAVNDPWGNAVALAPASNNTAATITVGGGGSETAAQCANVVQSIKDYVSIKVGATTFTPATPADPTTAAAACTATAAIAVTFQ